MKLPSKLLETVSPGGASNSCPDNSYTDIKAVVINQLIDYLAEREATQVIYPPNWHNTTDTRVTLQTTTTPIFNSSDLIIIKDDLGEFLIAGFETKKQAREALLKLTATH